MLFGFGVYFYAMKIIYHDLFIAFFFILLWNKDYYVGIN